MNRSRFATTDNESTHIHHLPWTIISFLVYSNFHGIAANENVNWNLFGFRFFLLYGLLATVTLSIGFLFLFFWGGSCLVINHMIWTAWICEWWVLQIFKSWSYTHKHKILVKQTSCRHVTFPFYLVYHIIAKLAWIVCFLVSWLYLCFYTPTFDAHFY